MLKASMVLRSLQLALMLLASGGMHLGSNGGVAQPFLAFASPLDGDIDHSSTVHSHAGMGQQKQVPHFQGL